MKRFRIDQLPPDDRDLVDRAAGARNNAYARYSNFLVGAAVRDAEGRVFDGANMENASYGVTICAEVAALTAASSAGSRSITAIAVVGGPHDASKLAANLATTPCGRCRQLIFEAAQVAGVDVKVISVTQDGNSALVATIGELLPEAFGPADLGLIEQARPKAATGR